MSNSISRWMSEKVKIILETKFFIVFKMGPHPKPLSFQMQKCVQITQKMMKWPICMPFIEMVDPERDGAPRYFEIIQEPMALSVVLQKLHENKYETIKDWKNDVNLIWSNARAYNGEDTLITYMAMEASRWFDEKTKDFPTTPEEEWTAKMQNATNKLLHVLEHPPADLDHNGTIAEIIEEEKNDN